MDNRETSSANVHNMIMGNFWHFVVIFGWFVLWGLLMFANYFYTIFRDFKNKFKQQAKDSDETDGKMHVEEQSQQKVMHEAVEKRKHLVINTILVTIIAVYTITLTTFLTTNSFGFQQAAPAFWRYVKANLKQSFSEVEYKKAVELFRQQRELPADMDWMDQRERPEYPLMYGPKSFVCSYNNLSYCKDLPT